MDQVFDVRQVCEQFMAKGKEAFWLLWLFNIYMDGVVREVNLRMLGWVLVW